MTGGGPGYATTTMEFLIYETGFNQGDFGTARALRPDSLRDHRHRRHRTASTHRIKRMTTLMPPKRQRKIGRWILFGSMMVVAVIMCTHSGS